MPDPRWKCIEDEAVNTEGYVIVPTDGSYRRYASPSSTVLFPTQKLALEALAKLEAQGTVESGVYRAVYARLRQHRTVEVLEQTPLRLVVDNP